MADIVNKKAHIKIWLCLNPACGRVFKNYVKGFCPDCGYGRVIRVRSVAHPEPKGISGKRFDRRRVILNYENFKAKRKGFLTVNPSMRRETDGYMGI